VQNNMIKNYFGYFLRVFGYMLIMSSINMVAWFLDKLIVVAGFSFLAGVVLVYLGNSINEIHENETPCN
jgi:hypothetical protein